MTEQTAVRISDVETKALVQLTDLLATTNGQWATEQQWRTHADRAVLRPVVPGVDPDPRARGFRINPMIEHGLVETTTAVIHTARIGVPQEAITLYRPKPTPGRA